MRTSLRLERSRHGIFYFRWPLPSHLQQPGKSRHVKVSLRTSDKKEALQLSRMLDYHASVLIEHVGLRFMDYGDIRNMVQDYFYELINQKKAQIHKGGPLPKPETWALIEQMELAQKAIEANADIISAEDTDARLQPILTRYEVGIAKGSDDYESLKDIYRRAFHGYCQKILSHNQKQLDYPFTTMPAYMKAVQINGRFTKPENRLGRVIDAYWAEMERINNWKAKRSKAQAQDSFAILKEVLGADFNTPDMTVSDARHVKDILMRMPSNRNKLKQTRDLPFMQQLEVKDAPRLAVASINKHLFTMGGLFDWAKRHGYTQENPFEGLALEEAKGQKKDPFTPEQVTTILDELAKGADGLAHMEFQYWSTLIGLYTGARQNEIASLTPADIKQKEGIWYFDITDEEEKKKTVKTGAAIREVPIHSELLKHGILELRDRVAAMGNDDLRLLYELTYKDESWGRKIERWFNGPFLKKLEVKSRRLTYHSLRKTAITTMRRAGVDNHIVRALVGHEPDGVTEAVYNAGFTMKQLQGAIETLRYV